MDTLGLLLVVLVTAASVQDREVLERLRFTMLSVALVWSDGGYAGRLVRSAKDRLRLVLQVVRKPADYKASRSCRGAGWWNAR
ncbi:MAG: hypothetical protein M3R63_09840 [Actinomycetota bacterium]|nr:hypothetical protein [Actinomycetota bacterium]